MNFQKLQFLAGKFKYFGDFWILCRSHCLKIPQNVAFEFWHFPPIFVLLKLTCLVTLFDRKLQICKNSPKWTILGIFYLLLSIQNVFKNVTKWDFLKIFTYNALHMIFLPIFYQFNGLVNWSYLIYDFPILLFFRPLQFSFLGQIYKTKSSSGMSSSSSSKKQRRCTSQKVTTSTSSSRNHVLESSTEDFTLNSDSAKNLSTQVILEN